MPAGENGYTGMAEDGSAGFGSKRVCGGAVGRQRRVCVEEGVRRRGRTATYCWRPRRSDDAAVTVMDFRLRRRARRRFAFVAVLPASTVRTETHDTTKLRYTPRARRSLE